MNPKVSVIMGIYNCAPYLQQALDSLYVQTFQNFELILCDDGSTDDTYQIALKYSKCHTNIILLKNTKNKGLNYTLNKCLSIAKGEYIARMDGDDLSLPDRFQKEIDFLDNNPQYAIVSTPMYYFDENGDFMVGLGGYEPNKKDFILGSPFCHAPCMVRREAYLQVNGYSEDRKYLRVEDYHLWYKMYKAGFRGYVLKDPLYKMRDSREALKRRTIQNRINEARLKFLIFKEFSLPLWMIFFCFKPFISLVVPSKVYSVLRRIGRSRV